MMWTLSVKLAGTLFLALLIESLNAQIIYYDRSPVSPVNEIIEMCERAAEIRNQLVRDSFMINRMEIHELKGEKYLLPDGRFDFYIWTGTEWKNLYKAKYYGYNYLSRKFVLNEKIASYGGYGYWRRHGEIIQFMPERREWEILDETRDLGYGHSFIKDNTLIILNSSPQKYDTDTREIIDAELISLPEISRNASITIEFENFLLLCFTSLEGKHYGLLSKEDLSISFSDLKPFDGIRNTLGTNSVLQIHGDSLKIYHEINGKLSKQSINYSADKESVFFNDNTSLVRGGLLVRHYAIALSILLLLSSTYILRRVFRINKTPRTTNTEIERYIFLLLQHDGNLLSSSQLDTILDLNDINIDETKRFKRSRLINDINEYYTLIKKHRLIERVKDPEDKRRFIYKVSK